MQPKNSSDETQQEEVSTRPIRRKTVYKGELYPIQLRNENGVSQAEIADISVNGLGLILQLDKFKALNLKDNQRVYVSASDQKNEKPFEVPYKLVHFHNLRQNQKSLVKVGLTQIQTDGERTQQKRQERHKAPDFIKTIVTFEHPYFPMRQVYGEIQNMSPNGISILSSLRNGDMLPNQQVRLTITFPLLGISRNFARIKGISLTRERNYVLINFEITSNAEEYQEKAVETLMMSSSSPSIKSLRDQGFKISQSSAGISFEYKSDKQDLHEIAKLRLRALQHQGEFAAIKDPNELIDSFDGHSRHIVARLNHKIIASTRLIFNEGNPKLVEHISYGAKIPDWLWSAGFVEAGRLVTDPDYRGSDLFLNMLRFLGKATLMSGYRYMISSCTSSLAKVYIRSGCKKLGSFYLEGDPNPWILLVVDFENTSKGIGINPIAWNILQRPMVEHLIEKQMLRLNLAHKMIFKIYKLFSPFSSSVIKFKRNLSKHTQSKRK